MSFHVLSSETLPLTKELAVKHRDMTPSPTERALDRSRVKYLKEKIDNGLFVCPTWAIAKYNGKEIRMNGQHSSVALTEANGEFPEGLFVHIDTYDVKEREGLAKLFRQFDARKSGRSATDVAGAYKGLCDELREVDVKRGLIAVKAVSWYKRQVEALAAPTGDDVGELFHDRSLHGFIKWVNTLLTIKTPELQRDTIVAAIYGTFITNESAAREFWKETAEGSGEDGSPSAVLCQTLVNDKEKKDPTKRMKAAQLYAVAVKGWNAWRQEKTVNTLSHMKGKPLPEIIG